jgi:hypothetical protein
MLSPKTVLVRAFKIKRCVSPMSFELDGEEDLGCTLDCEGGHHLFVNDAWAQVYSPESGGWLVVNKEGRPVYRSNADFTATCVHRRDNFYDVPYAGDLALSPASA